MKNFLYKLFVDNKVIDFLSLPLLGIVVPPFIGLYYVILDIWGNDWNIIKSYVDIHEFIFTLLAAFTVVILFLKGISEQFKGNASKKYQLILQELLLFINELVKKKRDRFHKKAKDIKRTGDVFKQITHPREQIEYALDGTKTFLSKGFGIDRKNIILTIIGGNPNLNKWWYEFKCDQQTQHTKAKDIMASESTAKHCYDSGESLFIPDLRKGVKEGVFHPSERYSRKESGSIFCRPVRIDIDTVQYVYIFTIVIYGQLLCTPYDLDECRATERILDEISDRIELELYLHSMRQYREHGGHKA